MSFFVDVFSNISLMCFFCSGIEQINIINNYCNSEMPTYKIRKENLEYRQ